MALAQDQGFPGVYLVHAGAISFIAVGVPQDLGILPFFNTGATIVVADPNPSPKNFFGRNQGSNPLHEFGLL